MISLIFAFFTAGLLSLIITFPIVITLQVLKAGQTVRAEGPSSHQVKTGTPTMAGIGFILTIIILTIILINIDLYPQYIALILLTVSYATIGLVDDLLKVFRGKNQGLTFWQKIIAQTLFAAGFSLSFTGSVIHQLAIIFIIVGAANATNLTDGLNGLLAGTAGIAFMAFAVLALQRSQPEAVTFSLISAGAIFAFLYYNFPKAKVFMGDVGSLAIGAALAGLAIIMHKELRLALIGGIFVIEALSVILQVFSYKLFKRRIFKMAPLHHHFELMGIAEKRVVIGFWVAGIILAVIGVRVR
ncbi:MAG: phospho-N-acetylmuramoyl-pentapeptide-transferase [bacterium]